MLGTFFYGCLYVFLHTCRYIGWFKWRVEGVENLPPRGQGGMVVVMNHIHWLDIPIIGDLVPFNYRLSWLGKRELFENPIAAWWLRVMNVIPIKRGKRDVAAMADVVQALQNGAVLLMFPEGTRSRDGILRQGRGGAIRMAIAAGVPIVPMALTGTEHGLKGTVRSKPVLVRIGEPYLLRGAEAEHLPDDVMQELTADMMRRIAALLPEDRRGIYGDGDGHISEQLSVSA
jgi:1-acyl-sn-glycerol-3-phosphate acyltransferase